MKIHILIIIIISYISIVLGPDFFLKSGFFYNLDSVFFPIYDFPFSLDISFFWNIYFITEYLLGYQLFSKLYLLFVLGITTGLGILVGKYIATKFTLSNISIKAMLYICLSISIIASPFLYERLMTQIHISLGSVMLGYGFILLLYFFEKGKDIYLYLSALSYGISLMIFPHSSIFIFLLGIVTLIFYPRRFGVKNIILSICILIGLNFNWIIATVFLNADKKYSTVHTLSSINISNVEGFVQSSIEPFGVLFTTLLGYGFWGERYGHVTTPNEILGIWWIFSLIFFGIVLFGFISFVKNDKKLAIYILLLYIIFFILSLGISDTIFKPFNQFLFEYIPFYIGMREPGKFLGIIAILNILLFGIGVLFIIKYLAEKKYFDLEGSKFDATIFFLLIFIIIHGYNPGMLWGFKGQLQIVQYPIEYSKAVEILIENNYSTNLLFPWHSYIRCEWGNGRVFSNTYKHFLNNENTIYADNIEIGNVYTNYDNPISQKVEQFLKTKDIEILLYLGVQTIVLQDKCADFNNYKFLEETRGLEKIYDTEYIKIYEINNEKK